MAQLPDQDGIFARQDAALSSCTGTVAAGVAQTVGSWREEWRQLALQAWSAESDSSREMQNARILNAEQLEELRTTLRRADQEGKVFQHELWDGLARIRKRVHALAQNVQFAPGRREVGQMVQSAEHELRVFSEQSRQQYDELAALECSLQDTLQAALVRFEGWCSQESALHKGRETSAKRCRPPSCSRLHPSGTGARKDDKQLADVRAQLETLASDTAAAGGATGGWTCEDNDAFLRLFRKFRSKTGPDFIAEAEQLLPEKTHEELVAHVAWLAAFDDRELEKRRLLEKWRGIRAAAAVGSIPSEGNKPSLTTADLEKERRRRSLSRERDLQEASRRRQSVTEWRSSREEAALAREEARLRQQKEAQLREVHDRQRQNEQKRKLVEAFRQKRAEDEELARSATHQASQMAAVRRAVSSEDRTRIAQRNTALLQRRVSQVQQRQRGCSLEQQNRFEPTCRSQAFQHVESRLRDHTDAYVEKARELRKEDSTDAGSKYGVMPGNFAHQGAVRTTRSCPTWRPRFGV